MFTDNYINYKALMFCGARSNTHNPHPSSLSFVWTNGATIGSTSSPIGSQYSFRGDLGYWITRPRCRTFPVETQSSDTEPAFGVYFGSGSTPATKADRTLENPISSGLTFTSIDNYKILPKNNGRYDVVVTFILKNTTGAEINVYEIGVVTPLAGGTYTYYPVLMERTVLTKPVTIPAGEKRAIEYRIVFNQTLNVEE